MTESDRSEEAERYARIQERVRQAGETFTPTRPVQMREIFAGRTEQLWECLAIPDQLGLHAILYGDRGVGKTSIANMVRLFSEGRDDLNVHKIECTSTDTFPSIIKQIYQQIPVEVSVNECGFLKSQEAIFEKRCLIDLVNERTSFNPKDVALLLKQVKCRLLTILDEFDRLDPEKFDLSSFTELIKISSDTDVDIHFLIVGVGESVGDIVGNHASIVTCSPEM